MVRLDDDPVLDEVDPDETAIIVVDMINEFVAEGAAFETPAAREMVPELDDLLEASREAGVHVVYLRQVNRRDGSDAGTLARMTPEILSGDAHAPNAQTEIYPPLEPTEEDTVVEKHQYDGFFQTELDNILRSEGISTVAITGVSTQICCDSTMRGAFFRGYDVVAIEGCNAAFEIPDQGWGTLTPDEINRFWYSIVASNFGDVLTPEAFVAELS